MRETNHGLADHAQRKCASDPTFSKTFSRGWIVHVTQIPEASPILSHENRRPRGLTGLAVRLSPVSASVKRHSRIARRTSRVQIPAPAPIAERIEA